MKKILVSLLAVLMVCAVWAGDCRFTLIAANGGTPLWKETISDPYGFTSKFVLQKAIDPDLRPDAIRTSVLVFDDNGNHIETKYFDLPYSDEVIENPEEYSTYNDLRTSINAGLFRFGWKNIEAELTLDGTLNTLFNIFSNSQCLGFDGTYLVGVNARFNGKYTIRAGIHHFSGHYGDEMMDDFTKFNKIDFSQGGVIKNTSSIPDFEEGKTYKIQTMMEYVRDCAWIAGIQFAPSDKFTAFSEVEIPWHKVWLRPFSDTVYGTVTPSNKPSIPGIGKKEGITQEQIERETELKQQGFYHALRVHLGAEYTFDMGKWGNLIASADFQLHQDGQTKHQINGYLPSNPWEYEVTVDLGWNLGKISSGQDFIVFTEYHDGRVSTLDFFYQRTKIISFGICIK